MAGLAAGGAGPAALAVATGVVGLLDDLATGSAAAPKGLRGHLTELRHGQITTGTLKIAGVGAAALVATVTADRGVGARTLPGVILVAGSANLLNLFDLRPGRALKVAAIITALPALMGDRAAAAALGVVLAAAPADLAARSMLGDTGANALGAVVGQVWSQRWGTGRRWAGAASVCALIVASEQISFTRFIAEHPVLDAIDRWGRR